MVAHYKNEGVFSTLETTGLLEVVTDVIIRRTASWTQYVWLSSSKCQLLALLTATTREVVQVMYIDLAR